MSVTRTRFAHHPRVALGPFTTVWRPRSVMLGAILLAVAVVLFIVSILVGDYPLTIHQIIDIISGGGGALERKVVLSWRLPRAVAAVVVGIALGLSGAITQSVTRNALASPDILGITSGASATAVTIIILGGESSAVVGILSGIGIPIAAFGGALLTSTLIWFLGSQRGLDTFRLVLAGIIMTALLHAYVTLLLVRADIRDAAVAKTWLTGSLALSTWSAVIPVSAVVLVCAPALAYVAFQIRAISLGDDTARGLGVRVTQTQVLLLLFAVLLAAVAVSATGPIGFVAFVAPQIALRLAKTAVPPLVTSAGMGAVLLLAADVVTRTVLPVELPVGILTAAIGGIFLIHVLIRANRRGSE